MDPASIIVVLLAAWAIAQRTPGIIGQAADEWRAGQRGDTTEAAEGLRGRLAGEGVEPSTGKGPLGNFLSNLWRDFWHNKAKDRERANAENEAAKERSRWQQQLTAAEDTLADKYRGTKGSPGDQTPPKGGPGGPAGGSGKPGSAPGTGEEANPSDTDMPPSGPPGDTSEPPRAPIHVQSTVGPEAPEPDAGNTKVVPQLPGSASDNPAPATPPAPAAGGVAGEPGGRIPASSAPESLPPLYVPPATTLASTGNTAVAVLDPPIAQPQIEGTQPMGTAVATNGVAIHSMTTGAYEMGSIDGRLHAAVAEFVQELTRLQNRLMRAGESTLGTVQMSGRSTVMQSMGQAVEAISALKAAARACTGEVSPLVVATKREFEKRI